MCGYARVSTDNQDQQTSYEAQLEYYTNYIQNRPDWDFVGMYSDEGISGTSTKGREGFKQMIQDALDGKIDLIITKSISRFARNTVDSLVNIRTLKAEGVEIFFEKENIWTFDPKGEMLITILASLAQDESRSISENVTWGIRKRYADGKVPMPNKVFGYDKGWVVNKQEAEYVRLIYRMFLEGASMTSIKQELEKRKVKTTTGASSWNVSTIRAMLQNEKYIGDALLQKFYTVDYLTKRQVKNEGQIPQYYIENHHEAIISRETFEAAKREFERRRTYRQFYNTKIAFSGRIFCGECGGRYGRKKWYSTSRPTILWQCNQKYKVKGEVKCHTPALREPLIQSYFMHAVNDLYKDKERYLHEMQKRKAAMEGPAAIKAKLDQARRQEKKLSQKVTSELMRSSRRKSALEFQDTYSEETEEYEKVKVKIQELEEAWGKAIEEEKAIDIFIEILEGMKNYATVFEDSVWNGIVDRMIVQPTGDVTFNFKGGVTLEVQKKKMRYKAIADR